MLTRGTHWTEWQSGRRGGFLVLRLVRDGRYVEALIPGNALARTSERRRRQYLAYRWRELRAELVDYARFRGRLC